MHLPASSLPRRRVLKIAAAAAGMPLAIAGWRAVAPTARFHEWEGEALGAAASLRLWHRDEDLARRMVLRTRGEIERLEGVFSLFRQDSELSRLNRDGRLAAPSHDLRLLLAESQRMADLSGGAFDPTVQPLWDLFEARHRAGLPFDSDFATRARAAAAALVDYRRIEVGARTVAFARPGMAATLNGIAQGYITDRVADMLRTEGFDHVVVDLGEVRTLGRHPEGRPWQIGLKDPRDPRVLARTVEVADAAVSVSGGYGTVFDPAGRHHHIFDPASGSSADLLLDVAVIAPRATAADALSTAIFVAGEGRAAALLAAYPGARAIVTRPDGTGAAIA